MKKCNVCDGTGVLTKTDMFGAISYEKCPACEAHEHYKKMFESLTSGLSVE